MIEVVQNPLMIDYLKVALALPKDEQEQIEAMTGEPFDVDGCAVGNFQVPGYKWAIKIGHDPLVIGGFVQERRGVWRDYLLTTPQAWEHWFPVTRICRRIMDAMLISGEAHRLECITPANRIASRPEIEKWYKVLSYKKEATLRGYCANGADAFVYSRVAH